VSKKIKHLDFHGPMCVIMLRSYVQTAPPKITEDQLKKALGGQKCPFCEHYLLGEREYDEHLMLEKLTRKGK